MKNIIEEVRIEGGNKTLEAQREIYSIEGGPPPQRFSEMSSITILKPEKFIDVLPVAAEGVGSIPGWKL